MPFTVRSATENDIEELFSIDAMAQTVEHRRNLIRRSVAAGDCFVISEEAILGLAILDYTFYDNGFVALLLVKCEFRRRGVGLTLMQYLESVCRTAKLFTSTNLSNIPMQLLLAKLGYKLSGMIHDLDEGDPELIYVKYLK